MNIDIEESNKDATIISEEPHRARFKSRIKEKTCKKDHQHGRYKLQETECQIERKAEIYL